jgi:hypothetical protein
VGLQGGLALGLLEMPPLGPIRNLYPIFHELLVKSPHLVSHIRTLHLGLPPLQSEIHPDSDFAVLSADDWRKIKEKLLDILHLLRGKGLTSLGLFPCGPGTHTFHLQPSISDIIRVLRPRSLEFCNWSFRDGSPLALLGHSSIESLKFVDSEFIAPLLQLATPAAYGLYAVQAIRCRGLVVFSKHLVPASKPYTQYLDLDFVDVAAMSASELSLIARAVGRSLTLSIHGEENSASFLEP